MTKLTLVHWLSLSVSLGIGSVITPDAIATEIGATSKTEPAVAFSIEASAPASNLLQLAQITSVSELTDVLPSDWAFQALQSLVENYGCIQGYPDRTFRGQRSLTRFEFAAGLNACLDVMAVLIAQSGIDLDDLAAIRRLQEEFQAELATLRGRVDALEAETAQLTAQQFSTTTKLRGEAVAHVGIPFDSIEVFDANGDPVVVENSTSVAARARLNFDTSFTGDDLLRIRLEAGQGNFLNAFDGLAESSDTGYDVVVDDFFYTFPIGNRIDINLAATGLSGDDWVTSTILPYHGPALAEASKPGFYNSGASTGDGAGVGINIALTDSLVLDLGYTAAKDGATNPAVGLFSAADQSYIAQLSYLSDGFLNAGFAYLHNDQSEAFTGGNPGGTDSFAGLLSLNFGNFFIAGHGAYQTFNGGNDFSWSAGLGFDDLFLEGAQFGIYVTQLPQLNYGYEDSLGQEQSLGRDSNPLFIEGYYQIPVNEFLTITPAIMYGDAKLNNPGGTRTEDTSFYGAIRAVFSF